MIPKGSEPSPENIRSLHHAHRGEQRGERKRRERAGEPALNADLQKGRGRGLSRWIAVGFPSWAKQHRLRDRAPLTPTWPLHLALAAGSYDPKAHTVETVLIINDFICQLTY